METVDRATRATRATRVEETTDLARRAIDWLLNVHAADSEDVSLYNGQAGRVPVACDSAGWRGFSHATRFHR